jgi:RHS repeat-associated protein
MNMVAPGGPLALHKNGYLYIWVSNETSGWDVFFDNLSVQYKQGPLLEESHYYPFGLTMAGISDKAIKTNYAENKYRYDGGTELQSKEFSDGSGLELYETSFRSFDPQLGRFFQIDPLADQFHSLTPYQYAGDNPVLSNDPTGLNNNSPSSKSMSLECHSPYGCGVPADPGTCTNCGFNDGSGYDWAQAQLDAADPVNAVVNGGGGTLIYQAGASGDLGNLASAYVALQNALGNPVSNTDTYFAQLVYSATYAGHASNITATLTPGGMEITATSDESGGVFTQNFSFADIDNHESSYLDYSVNLDGGEVEGSDWLDNANHFNDGIGGMGTGLGYSSSSFRLTNGSYNGAEFSPKIYASGWGGGSRAGITTYGVSELGEGIAKGSIALTIFLGAIDISSGINTDGGTFGANAELATGRVAGGLAGGYMGAELGAAFGMWFFGVGAVPGAIIGGIIGGALGGWSGSAVGQGVAQSIFR